MSQIAFVRFADGSVRCCSDVTACAFHSWQYDIIYSFDNRGTCLEWVKSFRDQQNRMPTL